jgi:ATP-binding cassette subfamily A (ABC1) protein 3
MNEANPKDYTVMVRNLRKVFMMAENKHKIAVDLISFGIENGECFTLLGVNGAGKTSTFKMLTGEIKPTSGDAYIDGYSVSQNLGEARKLLG